MSPYGAKERHSLSLFLKQKEVSSTDVANHLGIPQRSALHLLKKWMDKDFVKMIDQSRKTRTYGLTTEWELLIEQQRMEERKQKLTQMTNKTRKQKGAEIER